MSIDDWVPGLRLRGSVSLAVEYIPSRAHTNEFNIAEFHAHLF